MHRHARPLPQHVVVDRGSKNLLFDGQVFLLAWEPKGLCMPTSFPGKQAHCVGTEEQGSTGEALLKELGSQAPHRPSHPHRLWSGSSGAWDLRHSHKEIQTDTCSPYRCPHGTAGVRVEAWWYNMTRTRRNTDKMAAAGNWNMASDTTATEACQLWATLCGLEAQEYRFRGCKTKRTFNGRTQFYDTLNRNRRRELYNGPWLPFLLPQFSQNTHFRSGYFWCWHFEKLNKQFQK